MDVSVTLEWSSFILQFQLRCAHQSAVGFYPITPDWTGFNIAPLKTHTLCLNCSQTWFGCNRRRQSIYHPPRSSPPNISKCTTFSRHFIYAYILDERASGISIQAPTLYICITWMLCIVCDCIRVAAGAKSAPRLQTLACLLSRVPRRTRAKTTVTTVHSVAGASVAKRASSVEKSAVNILHITQSYYRDDLMCARWPIIRVRVGGVGGGSGWDAGIVVCHCGNGLLTRAPWTRVWAPKARESEREWARVRYGESVRGGTTVDKGRREMKKEAARRLAINAHSHHSRKQCLHRVYTIRQTTVRPFNGACACAHWQFLNDRPIFHSFAAGDFSAHARVAGAVTAEARKYEAHGENKHSHVHYADRVPKPFYRPRGHDIDDGLWWWWWTPGGHRGYEIEIHERRELTPAILRVGWLWIDCIAHIEGVAHKRRTCIIRCVGNAPPTTYTILMTRQIGWPLRVTRIGVWLNVSSSSLEWQATVCCPL